MQMFLVDLGSGATTIHRVSSPHTNTRFCTRPTINKTLSNSQVTHVAQNSAFWLFVNPRLPSPGLPHRQRDLAVLCNSGGNEAGALYAQFFVISSSMVASVECAGCRHPQKHAALLRKEHLATALSETLKRSQQLPRGIPPCLLLSVAGTPP